MTKSNKSIVNFLFEVGILSKTPRTGFHFLGSGKQSVAEHINRVVYIGYILSALEKNIDISKVMKMCLFHDLAEARTSDLNYVHQKYTSSNEQQAIKELTNTLPFGSDILNTLEEYSKRKSREAILAKDADQLEWILSLKEEVDIGNKRAKAWISIAIKRLKTKGAQDLAVEIINTNSDEWFNENDDDWWINRGNKTKGKRY